MSANFLAPSPEDKEYMRLARERFPGIEYMDWLKWLHHILKPKSYVEIGIETGRCLQLAQGHTKSVGIDPEFAVTFPIETWVKLFKLPSDQFFMQHDLKQVLGEKFVDLAFIDGLHTFDQALKDFINIEKYASPKTIVVFHDTYPVTPITASRERQSFFSLGDTWKIVFILKQLRPELKLFTLPTYPSGLTIVTGLNGKSDILPMKLEGIIEQWINVDITDYLEDMDEHLNVIANDYIIAYKLLKAPSFLFRFLP